MQLQDAWGHTHAHENEVVKLLQEAFDTQPDGSLARAGAADALGITMYTRYLREGRLDDLTAAIANFRQASFAQRVFRTSAAANLAMSLLRLYRYDGNEEHLAEATAVAEPLIANTPPTARQWPTRLTLLADILRCRYECSSDETYLDRAIDLLDEAWESLGEANREGRRTVAVSLSHALLAVWNRRGNPEHALRAVDIARHAVNLAASPGSWHAEDAGALGAALLAVNEVNGEPTLAEAIRWLRVSVERTPDADIRKPGRLSNLSYALQALYRAEGTLVAIDEAVAVSEEAVQLAHDDDGDCAIYLFACASAHSYRYEAFGERRDLAGSLIFYNKALDSLPDSSEAAPLLYANLAGALLDRHKLGEYAEDLDMAIDHLEAALGRVPDKSRDRQRICTRLAGALLMRYDRNGNSNDIYKAVDVARESVIDYSNEISLTASGQIVLGRSLAAQADANGLSADHTSAYAVLRDCCMNTVNIVPTAALTAATSWAEISVRQGNHHESASAYRHALVAERRIYQSQLTRQDQQTQLRVARSIFTSAAFSFARVGDIKEAALAVENGRARLITERLGRSRADLDAIVSIGYPELARALVAALTRVNTLEAALTAPPLTPMPSSQRRSLVDVEDLTAARSEVDDILGQIRGLPGLAEFLLDTNWDHVAAASESGPLLYLLAGDDGGLVLIVDAGEVRQLSPSQLPLLTETAVLDRVVALLQTREEDFPAWLDLLEETLHWSWDALIGAVLDATSGAETLNIIPCGLLALLPLHAAWTKKTDGTRLYADDHVVWRYQPNARCMLGASAGLRMAQTTSCRDERAPTALVVHSPARSDLASPRSAAQDHVLLRQKLNVVELVGVEATSDRVIAALPTAEVVHFACHAQASLRDAESSAFLLAGDDRLTVGHLLRVPTGQQRLAVLAACETGVPDGLIPDETVTLGTSLLVNGASGVLASLWKVSDRATNLLVDKFYELWLASNDDLTQDPARALRDAQRWIRTLPGQHPSFAHPSLWAGFTFMGTTYGKGEAHNG